MDKKAEIRAMIEHPEYLLHAEKMSLDKRIEQKKLDSKDVRSAVVDTAKSKGKQLAVDVLNGKWGDLILDLVDTGDHLKGRLDDMKKTLLLAEYLQKTDDQEQGLHRLSSLLTNPYGLSIYSKIVSLLSDAPSDDDMLDIMSDYLGNLANEKDWGSTFSKNKSILNLIDRSSPLALTLLRNSDHWPLVPGPKAFIAVDGRVQGDNTGWVATAFSKVPVFSNIEKTSIQMAIVDLESNKLAEFISGTLNPPYANPNNPSELIYAERPTDAGNMLKAAVSKSSATNQES